MIIPPRPLARRTIHHDIHDVLLEAFASGVKDQLKLRIVKFDLLHKSVGIFAPALRGHSRSRRRPRSPQPEATSECRPQASKLIFARLEIADYRIAGLHTRVVYFPIDQDLIEHEGYPRLLFDAKLDFDDS